MSGSYTLKLLCLSLASFFLINLMAGVLVSLVSPMAVRFSQRITARAAAARFLLILRLFPPVVSLVLVAGLCVPSYLWLEPAAATEDIGAWCLGAALLGVAIWGISFTRGVRAVAGSFRYIRYCEKTGRKRASVWIVEDAAPVLGLAGIIRPQLVMSRALMSALTKDELAAALRHERAHGVSRDNLKRLLILLSPNVFPFVRGFTTLERGWAKFTEWSADDRAVAGNSERSLSLASALVRVARMNPAPQSSALVASLLADGRDLSARVDRLLYLAANEPKQERHVPIFAVSGIVVLVTVMAIVLEPATFQSVHQLLEHLVR